MDEATLPLSLLCRDYIFFQDGEIAWDGNNHRIVGVQINAAKVDEFQAFQQEIYDEWDDFRDLTKTALDMLSALSNDAEFRIPRNAIAPGVARALPQGDLTAMTFANLFACDQAMTIYAAVADDGEDIYLCYYDTRLSKGIPHFFNLLARLIWDLRKNFSALKGTPFKLGFMPTANPTNRCLGEVPHYVSGAQDPLLLLQVDELPQIDAAPNPEKAIFNKDDQNVEPEANEAAPQEAQPPLGGPAEVDDGVLQILDNAGIEHAEVYTQSELETHKATQSAAAAPAAQCGGEPEALSPSCKEQYAKAASAISGVAGDLAASINAVSRDLAVAINEVPAGLARAVDAVASQKASHVAPSSAPEAKEKLSKAKDSTKPAREENPANAEAEQRENLENEQAAPISVDQAAQELEAAQAAANAVVEAAVEVDPSASTNNASMPLILLGRDYIFFKEGSINWDGKAHSISGVQVNSALYNELQDFNKEWFSDCEDAKALIKKAVSMLRDLELDEELRIPRTDIAKGICCALPEGDLTGITLANLCACDHAIMVTESLKATKKYQYSCSYDPRLRLGIPHFFDLIARLVWDLRKSIPELKDMPFAISFAPDGSHPSRSLQDVSVEAPGAQEPVSKLLVTSPPKKGGSY